MEADRSFSSFFPVSQTQINPQCRQRDLQKQQQMREKEEQLHNQLEVICLRQHEAHKRNRNLLRDFKKIQQELALLAVKTDNLRRNQDTYKKQLQTLISMDCKCAAPNSYTKSHADHTCNMQINNLPTTNYGHLCKSSHLSASVGDVGQDPMNFSLCPNQHIRLKGCCNHSPCCVMYPYLNGHLEVNGGFAADEFKIPDTTLESQSQKKRYPTKDSLFHRDEMLTYNRKGARIQQYPEVRNYDDGAINVRTIPSHVHGDFLQGIRNSDKYRVWREKLFMGPQQRMMEDEVVPATERRSIEEYSREIPVLHQDVSSISECHQKSTVSSTKSQHLPSLPLSARHDNNDFKTASKANKSTQNIYEKLLEGETSEQNKLAHPLTKGQLYNSKTSYESLGMSFSLKDKSVDDGFEGGGVVDDIIKVNKVKKGFRTKEKSKMFEVSVPPGQELNIRNSSEEGSISEVTTRGAFLEELSNPVHSSQYDRNVGMGFLRPFLKESLEEFTDSDQEDKLLKVTKMGHKLKEAGRLTRHMYFKNKHSQDEDSVLSDLSEGERRTIEMNSRSSMADRGPEIKEQSIVRGEYKCELGSLTVDNFIKNSYKKEGMMGLDITGQENELSEESECQNEELDDDDRYMELSKENVKKIGEIVVEEEGLCEMYGADIEINSNGKKQEKTGSKSSKHEMVNIVIVKEGVHKDGKDNKDHESDIEDTDDEEDRRTSGEDEIISEEEKSGSQIVIMDRGEKEGVYEERCNTEVNKETIIAQKEMNKKESDTGNENDIISEGETQENPDTSEGEQSVCDYQDESDDLDGSEEEENTDFWGSKDEETESEMEEIQKDVRLRTSSKETLKQINIDNSRRKEESPQPQEPDMAAFSSQNLMEDEQTDTERQSRESQPLDKGCSEDGSKDLLQMNPVESRSLLPALETNKSPTFSRNAEAASIPETHAEDSSEELFHSKKESENPNQPWSDSEDNLHSFYD